MGMLGGTPFNDRNTGLYHAFLFLGAEHLVILVRTTLYCLKTGDMSSASKHNILGHEVQVLPRKLPEAIQKKYLVAWRYKEGTQWSAEVPVSSCMQPELKSAEVEGKADVEELFICLCNSFPSLSLAPYKHKYTSKCPHLQVAFSVHPQEKGRRSNASGTFQKSLSLCPIRISKEREISVLKHHCFALPEIKKEQHSNYINSFLL